MKDNKKLLAKLNQILASEQKTFKQNWTHSVMDENSGKREPLNQADKEISDELKQAEWIINQGASGKSR